MMPARSRDGLPPASAGAKAGTFPSGWPPAWPSPQRGSRAGEGGHQKLPQKSRQAAVSQPSGPAPFRSGGACSQPFLAGAI